MENLGAGIRAGACNDANDLYSLRMGCEEKGGYEGGGCCRSRGKAQPGSRDLISAVQDPQLVPALSRRPTSATVVS